MYSFTYLEPVCCFLSSSNCCFLSSIRTPQNHHGETEPRGLTTPVSRAFPESGARGRERLSARCSLLRILHPASGCSDHVPSATVTFYRLNVHFKSQMGESPGGPMGKNPPPTQGTRIWSLVQEDSTCRRAAKPVCRNYCACALDPSSCSPWSPSPTWELLSSYAETEEKARTPKTLASQQETPLQWEAQALQLR